MPQSINLIPKKEKQEQQKVALVKASTVFAVIILIAVTGISFYYFFETRKFKKDIADVDSSIASYRDKITKMQSVEIAARNLDKKYNIVQELFKSRLYYSTLFEEFRLRQPVGVEIKSFDVRDTTINVTGSASSYTSVAAFVSNLLAEDFDTEREGLFTEVGITSVSLDSASEDKKFSLSIEFVPEELLDL